MTRFFDNAKTVALAGLIAVSTLAGWSGKAEAAVERIDCPRNQVRGEIVNGLPGGWWTTPYVNTLESTRVVNSGGATYLVCDYGAAGFIQREAPAGANCNARRGGFRCQTLVIVPIPVPIPTPIPTPTPIPGPVDGEFGLRTGHGFDLDGGSGNDIARSGATNIVLQNGAARSNSFGSAPNQAACAGAGYTSNPFDAQPGTHWCIRTSDGRYARIHVTAGPASDRAPIMFSYRTWP